MRAAGVEDDGAGQLADHRHPAHDCPGKNARDNHRQQHFAEGCLVRCAERDSRFFDAGRDLPDDGGGAAHGVGHAANDKGDDEDERRAGQQQRRGIESKKKSDTKHRAGDDIGEHGDGVDRAVDDVFVAHGEISDEYADQHNQCDGGKPEAVGIPQGIAVFRENGGVVFQRVCAGIDLPAARLQEAGVNHHGLRHDGKRHHAVSGKMDEYFFHAAQCDFFHGFQGAHRVAATFGQKTLRKEKKHGQRDDDQTQGGSKAVIAAHFAHELVINKHRHGFIAFADQHGCAEIGKDTHEDKQRTGK